MKMRRTLFFLLFLSITAFSVLAQQPRFRVLAFYSTKVESDHVDFAKSAITFFSEAGKRDNFEFVATTNWDDMNTANLAKYNVLLWLDDAPVALAQRMAFEQYMTHGGGWLGFHIAGYTDSNTHWPWFVDFLGATEFYGNSWPPIPAKLIVDVPGHPVTRRLPPTFIAPANEWYSWKPNPRLNKEVKVLITLDPSNYPLGFKDTLTGGDIPVVWTNTHYKMLYVNMGHGDKIFTTQDQNHLFEDALLWLGTEKAKKL
jgi:type 1 glutamine amidotransferase